jgi:hypothetical protein
MVAFNSSGQLFWSQANDSPQSATSDGGIIGSSGVTYDQNGNANGQAQVISPDWQGQSFSAGGSGIQINYSFANLAPGFAPMAGINPSGIASVANIGSYESIPMWFFSLGGAPKCALGNNKIALGSGVATKYNQQVQHLYDQLKQNLIDGGYMTSQKCAVLFIANSSLTQYLGQLTSAVQGQVPYDGLQTNISMYDAGLWTQDQTQNATTLSQLKSTAVCNDYRQANGDWNGTVAQAQIQSPATDAYIYSGKEALKNLTQATLLHESLHRITGLSDADLYKLLSGKVLGTQASALINTVLLQNGCAGN